MKKLAHGMVGAGILLLAGGWGIGQYGGVAAAKEKRQEVKGVKVRLMADDGKGLLNADPLMEVSAVRRTDKEWASRLTLEQFRIGRTQGTERAFCGVFHDNHKNGVYFCAGCGLPLFKSDD